MTTNPSTIAHPRNPSSRTAHRQPPCYLLRIIAADAVDRVRHGQWPFVRFDGKDWG